MAIPIESPQLFTHASGVSFGYFLFIPYDESDLPVRVRRPRGSGIQILNNFKNSPPRSDQPGATAQNRGARRHRRAQYRPGSIRDTHRRTMSPRPRRAAAQAAAALALAPAAAARAQAQLPCAFDRSACLARGRRREQRRPCAPWQRSLVARQRLLVARCGCRRCWTCHRRRSLTRTRRDWWRCQGKASRTSGVVTDFLGGFEGQNRTGWLYFIR